MYEKTLLQYYQLYLQRLQRIINSELAPAPSAKTEVRSNFYHVMLTTRKARSRLTLIACHCLSQLVQLHYNFNDRDSLIDMLAHVLCNTSRASNEMRLSVSKAFIKLFQMDTLGEASLCAVQSIQKLILKYNFRVHPIVLKTFLFLNLRELVSPSNSDLRANKSSKPKKDRKKMSRNERKRNKHFSKLEKEMLETEAVEDRAKCYQFKMEIHKHICSIYFRFLKRCIEVTTGAVSSTDGEVTDFNKWYRPLFDSLLAGVSKYSVYLNEDYIYTLIDTIRKLIQHGTEEDENSICGTIIALSATERLHCLRTIFKITSNAGNFIQIDFEHLYRTLFELCGDPVVVNESLVPLLQCIEVMILKRIKLINVKRLLSFVQRLV